MCRRSKATWATTLKDWSYYLCGPKPLVADLTAGLKARHVPARHIHHEEFELR